LRLPNKVKDDLLASRLSMGHARALLSLESDEDITEASDEVIRKKLSVRETEALVKKIKNFTQQKKPQLPPVKEVDANLIELESTLKQALGAQVKLTAKGQGGRIEINYHDQVELERLLELFGVTG
jgi:ParB family chromosome partitioning protein